MRVMKRIDDKWQTVYPENLSRWLWQNQGTEAVVVDDAAKVYYCGCDALAGQYKEAWGKEKKRGDKRRVSTFLDLDRQLFAKETPITPDQSPAWCESEMCLCSEIVNCTGACLA